MRYARTEPKRTCTAKNDQRLAEREAEVPARERKVRLVDLMHPHAREPPPQCGRRRYTICGGCARTLSISTSQSWLKPTMQTFMNSAGMMAWSTPIALVTVRSAGLLKAMSETETMLNCSRQGGQLLRPRDQ